MLPSFFLTCWHLLGNSSHRISNLVSMVTPAATRLSLYCPCIQKGNELHPGMPTLCSLSKFVNTTRLTRAGPVMHIMSSICQHVSCSTSANEKKDANTSIKSYFPHIKSHLKLITPAPNYINWPLIQPDTVLDFHPNHNIQYLLSKTSDP